MEEHLVSSVSGEYSRKVWLLDLRTKQKVSGFGIFLDGEFYLDHMTATSIFEQLIEGGKLPPMLIAFVSHVDGKARHLDLTCNPRYSDFIARDLIEWLCNKGSLNSEGGHLIAGASLGGLAAAHVALAYPTVFSHCLSQSGSFWWKDEWVANHLGEMPVSSGRFWLSVGDQETASGVSHPPIGLRQDVSQIAACERVAAELNKTGRLAHYSVYAGGHDFKAWKAELPDALTWLFR